MSIFIQTEITKQKFLQYDFRECNITKCFIKKDIFFDVLKQSPFLQIDIKSIVCILKCIYSYLIRFEIDTSKAIKEHSPITYNGQSCFEIDTSTLDNCTIIREIFNVCVRNNMKLHIEITLKNKSKLCYKDI